MLAGVGVTFHPALLSRVLASPPAFLEIVAESVMTSSSARRQARALAEVCPLSLHGTGLSLGSVDGFDPRRAEALARLRDELGAVACSEHLAFVRTADVDVSHLTPLPFTRAAVDVVAANLGRVAKLLPDLWLENVWSPLPASRLPDELEEPEFLRAVVDATGCGLLLDVANLWANATNRGLDASAWIDRLPLASVRQLHIAGSHVVDGFVIDSHADAVPAGVSALAAGILARTGPLPICLERDRDVDVDGVFGELAQLRSLLDEAPPAPAPTTRPPTTLPAGSWSAAQLGAWQRDLARSLVGDDDGDPDLRHARAILARKHRERRTFQKNTTKTTTTTKSFFSALWGPS